MIDELRRSAAHVLVDDVGAPTLDDAARHHLVRVLRLRAGDVVTVTDGAGAWRRCVLAGTDVEPDGPVQSVPRRATPLTVAVVIPKADRPEWTVQKLTEIGIDRVVLLHSARSVVRWEGDRAARQLERLRRVASEAAMQSRRVWLPEVTGPVPALDVLPAAAAAEPGGRDVATGDHTVAVGPEGGWTDQELAAAADRVGLGDTVLRVETAALVAAVRLVAAHVP